MCPASAVEIRYRSNRSNKSEPESETDLQLKLDRSRITGWGGALPKKRSSRQVGRREAKNGVVQYVKELGAKVEIQLFRTVQSLPEHPITNYTGGQSHTIVSQVPQDQPSDGIHYCGCCKRCRVDKPIGRRDATLSPVAARNALLQPIQCGEVIARHDGVDFGHGRN